MQPREGGLGGIGVAPLLVLLLTTIKRRIALNIFGHPHAGYIIISGISALRVLLRHIGCKTTKIIYPISEKHLRTTSE